MLTDGVNNTLIKSIGGFLGCYSMYIMNMIVFLCVKKMNFVYSLQFKFV